MIISTRGRYALRVMIDLSQQDPDSYTPLKEIAARQEISEKYLENILKSLVTQGFILGLRGKGGGYRLCKSPDQFTTGSSIMQHKKNPDVFELTRAKCNKLQSLPQQIMMIMNNLPSGYFRDLQIIKEVFLPAFEELKDCLRMSAYIMDKIKVNEHILDDDKYLYIFSVEEVNRLAAEGMPFRDAYKKVGLDIEAGKFTHNKQVHHTHAGSIGNLCNDKIVGLMEEISKGFNFSAVEQAEKSLLGR